MKIVFLSAGRQEDQVWRHNHHQDHLRQNAIDNQKERVGSQQKEAV